MTKPVSHARIALMTSAALRLSAQPPFTENEDLSYRLVPSDPQAGKITIDHHSKIGAIPRQDPEIIFPRAALASLAERQIVGSLSSVHISFLGGMRCHREIENELAPAMARELTNAEVDLALLVPYWPYCHETVGLVAHVLENAQIPTLVIGTALDIMTRVRPPRAVFTDHPVGRTFGPPADRLRHEQVLAAALGTFPKFSQPGEILDLHCQWDPNGDRAWEDELRALLLGS